MKQLREYIKNQITHLTEKKYELPVELTNALKFNLKLNPLVRYVNYTKAVNSIHPSYEIFLVNGTSFFLIYESFSLAVEIKNKKYYLGDVNDLALAKKEINNLLTDPQFNPKGGAEGEEEPTEEEPAEEEPAEEPEA